MPTKEQKNATVGELQTSFGRAKLAIVADYRGLSVAQLTDLRRRVQGAGGDITISKNTLIKVATKDQTDWASLDGLLSGPTALVFGYDDVVAPAKVLSDFAKEKRAVKITIRGGVLQGKAVTAKGVEGLAALPSREVLLSQLLQVMNGPITGFVNVLVGGPRKLVYALEAIRKLKEEKEGPAAQAEAIAEVTPVEVAAEAVAEAPQAEAVAEATPAEAPQAEAVAEATPAEAPAAEAPAAEAPQAEAVAEATQAEPVVEAEQPS